MKQRYMKRLPEYEVEYVPVPKHRRYRHHGLWLATGWSDMQPTEEHRKFANDVWYAETDERRLKIWHAYYGLPKLMFWDTSYNRDTWAGHTNTGRYISTERAFRRHLKKLADILPNGLVMMLPSRYQYEVKGKHTELLIVGKIQGKLSVDESRKLIRKQMDAWYEAHPSGAEISANSQNTEIQEEQ